MKKKSDNVILDGVFGGAAIGALVGLIISVHVFVLVKKSVDHSDNAENLLLQALVPLSATIGIPVITVTCTLLCAALGGAAVKLGHACCLFVTKQNNRNINQNMELHPLSSDAYTFSYDAAYINY